MMKLVIQTFVVLLVALSFMPLAGERNHAIAAENAILSKSVKN